jgi:peptidyl-prolyl cis-trans isomerase SurA
MKKLHLAIFTLCLATIALKADNIVDEIIARVNDQIITRSEFEKAKTSRLEELKQAVPDWQSKWEQAQKEVLRDLIDRQLLLEKGKELGVTGETETVKRLNQMRQQMGLASMEDLEAEAKKQGVQFEDFKEQIRTGVVTEKVIGQEVGSKIHITNEEVQEFYNQHQKELEGPEEVSLSEILISTQPAKENVQNKDNPNSGAQDKPLPEDPAKVAEAQKKAEDAEKTLRSGNVKFEDLAKKISEGSTAAQGGALGTFKRGELAKEIEDATFSLKPAEYTKPIRTRQGFIIFKVNAHRSAGVPPLKEVEDRIREAIYSQKLEPAARAYLSKLREQAYIDIKPGYTDTGAVAGQANKPVMVAAAGDPAARQGKTGLKKKKKFLLF